MPGLSRRDHNVKKALLIGIEYSTTLKEIDPVWELRGAHEDPKTLRQLLIDVYGYKDEDITVLVDEPDLEQDAWPTRKNILAAMRELVEGAQPGDCFVFSFSGHGSQVTNEDGTEEDGLDETLIPVDAILDRETNSFENYIKDDDVRKIIVDSLPSGARCVMIFDCCHSGTASDLPNVFSDGFTSPCSPLTTFAPRSPWKTRAQSTDMEQINVQHTAARASTQFAWMKGRHTRTRSNTMPPQSPGPDVTSWSACMDSQVTYGGRKGGFFIKAFTDALRIDPHQTHAELLQSVRRELAKYSAAHNMRMTQRGKATGTPAPEPVTSPRAQLASLRQSSNFHTPFGM
ncbi:peptidase C14 [Lenzites betulinus]|nr:peptidase C14 [Lenzites betulinus]